MKKTELVKALADKAELTNKDAAKALDAFIDYSPSMQNYKKY